MTSRAAARLARIERKTAPGERRIVVVGDSDELELATKFLRSKAANSLPRKAPSHDLDELCERVAAPGEICFKGREKRPLAP